MAFWGMGPMVGPILGPIAGGFLSQAKGWRWVFWLLTIVSGVIAISAVIFLQETYPVLILERKTKRLIKETGNPNLRSKLATDLTPKEYFKRAIIRPLKFIYGSPIVLLLSLYIAVVFGMMYLLLTTIPRVFQEQYGFGTGVVGLVYLGMNPPSHLVPITRTDTTSARPRNRPNHRSRLRRQDERSHLQKIDHKEQRCPQTRVQTTTNDVQRSIRLHLVILVRLVRGGKDPLDRPHPRYCVLRPRDDWRFCKSYPLYLSLSLGSPN